MLKLTRNTFDENKMDVPDFGLFWKFQQSSSLQHYISCKFCSSSVRPAEQNIFTLVSGVWLVLISATDKGRLLCCCRETHPAIQSFFFVSHSRTNTGVTNIMNDRCGQFGVPVGHTSDPALEQGPATGSAAWHTAIVKVINYTCAFATSVPNVCGENTFRARRVFFLTTANT